MGKMYYMSRMEFEVSIPVEGKEPLKIKDTIEQLVYASTKDNARKAVMDDLKRQHPDARIYECRIHDTIIGA